MASIVDRRIWISGDDRVTQWSGYKPYPGVWGPLNELDRQTARAAFDRLMAAKQSRITALRQLMSANGIQLEDTDIALQRMEDWFREAVEQDTDKPGRRSPIWYSVVNDLALYLGEVLIARAPNLHWTFFLAGERNVAYQRHVIMDFGKVANPRYNFDVDRWLATYAHRLIAGLPTASNQFVAAINHAAATA